MSCGDGTEKRKTALGGNYTLVKQVFFIYLFFIVVVSALSTARLQRRIYYK